MPENPNPTTNPTTSTATESLTPEAALIILKAELEKQESELGTRTKQKDDLKTHVDALSKIVDEIKKSSAGFGAGAPDLKKEVKTITDHYNAELTGVEAQLGEKKGGVDKEIEAVGTEIKKQQTEVEKLQKDATDTAKSFEDAKTNLDAAQKKYDELKDLQKTLGDNIKKLHDLENKIEAFDKQTKPASEYVLLKEEEKLLKKTEVPSEEDYKKKLNDAWQALDTARTDLREKKLAAGTAKDALEKGQAALKQLENNRVANTLERVDKIK